MKKANQSLTHRKPSPKVEKRNKLRCTTLKLRRCRLLSDFNILSSTMRGNERQMCYELAFLLKEIGDADARVEKSGIRGLVVAKTNMPPVEAVEKLRVLLKEKPYEFRYSQRIIPVQKVVHTELEEVKKAAVALSTKMNKDETFRVTVEKRFTNIHSRDFIEAAATNIQNRVDLKNPNWILLIENIGGYTGVSLLNPNSILSILKAKML